jgi:transketolase
LRKFGGDRRIGGGNELANKQLVIGVDRFGTLAFGDVVMKEYGFNVENVRQKTVEILAKRGSIT